LPPTKNVRIDKASLEEARKKYPNVLPKLRDALPKDTWPTTDASSDEEYYGAPFYPGRVLLGKNDSALIWAHLRKTSQNKMTKIAFYYSDYGSDEDDDRTPFNMSDFAP
jgi:hypothetical protein